MTLADRVSPLRREIGEQPECVERLLLEEGPRVRAIGRSLGRRRPPFVLVVARGTSDNAARYAQYAFGHAVGLPVALAAPSLTTLYHRRLRLKRALVLGISQSGRSPDVVETVAAARREGALTLALVNDSASPLARAAAEVLPLHAGEERSVAATKTYTAELAAVALLAAAMAEGSTLLEGLRAIPPAMARALTVEEQARRAAATLVTPRRAVVLARGINYPTAHEVALKLKELALLLAEPYSSADFRHGPIAMAEPDLPVLLISPPGSAASRELAALARALRRRGSPVLPLGPNGRGALVCPRVPEILSPLVAILPGQLLAFHAALARGLDPDRPRGLRKITATR